MHVISSAGKDNLKPQLVLFLFIISLSSAVTAEQCAINQEVMSMEYAENGELALTSSCVETTELDYESQFKSDEIRISFILGALSKHLNADTYKDDKNDDKRRKFNENNLSLGIAYNNWSVLYAKLSYYNDGLAGYYTYKTYRSHKFDFGFRIGLVFGYEDTPADLPVLPLFSPVLEYKPTEEISVESAAMIGGSGVFILMLNAKYNF